jgi:uncharacterized protein (TIGR03790 family)
MTPTRPPSSSSILLFTLCVVLFTAVAANANNDGQDIVVVFNSAMPESKDVADHYASARNVPSSQVIGFNLPRQEAMTRAQFREQLQDPLAKFLEKQTLLTFQGTNVTSATIRYIVLCYGVPLRIENDPKLHEKGESNVKVELRNNGAAVDSELAILPSIRRKLPLAGPLSNPAYHGTNAAAINPTNGTIMVARLDGPTAAIARSLVDKAMQAERDGLWGRAYIDMRGIKDKDHASHDTNFLIAAQAAERAGFETFVDRQPETFPKWFPMSQIALYAGWYDENVSGPFARAKVEFMPGAFAYHLHSFNAATLRSTDTHWAGPLLAKGATATMGAVDEPFLDGLPDMSVFFTRWLLLKMTYGEAAYSSLQAVSWQVTVIGDPLYQPFRKAPATLHQELSKSGSKLIEWSHLRVVDLDLATGSKIPELIQYLNEIPETKASAILTEKLGDFLQAQGKTQEFIDAYHRALKLDPSPQQEVRLRLGLMKIFSAQGNRAEALAEFEEFKKHCSDFPDLAGLEQQVRATPAPAPK